MGRKAKREKELCCCTKGSGGEKRPADHEGSDGDEHDATAVGNNGLPMANLVRLMRQVIPPQVKISTRAKQLTHDCAVEFVGFVGGEASECAVEQHRRTIAPEDFTWAFQRLGFDDYVEPMSTYISRYRENNHNNVVAGGGGTSCSFPPPPAGEPCSGAFTVEEMQFLRSVVPPPHGEYDGAASTSEQAPPLPEHSYGCM